MLDLDAIERLAKDVPYIGSDRIDLRRIVQMYLTDYAFDGLYAADGVCTCVRDDLFPCDEPRPTCRPGYRVPCDCGGHDFHVVSS